MGYITKWPAKLKAHVLDLWKSNSSPHEIAMGVAIGVFIGITPFYGFHMLTALFIAFILKRVNKVAIFLGMNISIPPTIPLITYAGYSIGRMFLGGSFPVLGWDAYKHFGDGTFLHLFYALVVGSLILGTVLSGLFYIVTYLIFNKRKTGHMITG